MSLNSYKTKYMTITTRQIARTYLLACHFILEMKKLSKQEHKVLGVTVDNLSRTNHVNELTKRVSQKLYQLSIIKHFLLMHENYFFMHISN